MVARENATFFNPLHAQLALFLSSTLRGDVPRTLCNAQFAQSLRVHMGDATFASAFARTGRIVSVVVSASAGSGVQPLLLNYATSPDVLIYSAVAASCALPGLLLPTPLMELDPATGSIRPWSLDGTAKLDGSMSADLPVECLRRQFGVTNLLVSQANPHVVPFLRVHEAHAGRNLLSEALHRAERQLASFVHLRVQHLARARLIPRWFGGELLGGVFLQVRFARCGRMPCAATAFDERV